MSYDYEKTSTDLYRAIFKDNYVADTSCYLTPDRALAEIDVIAPILHPTFEDGLGVGGVSRAADIVQNKGTGLYDPDTGGTSVFDRSNVLRRADGDFKIPEGTDIPPDLKIRKDGFNKRLKATHHTIMPSKPVQKIVLMGALDNLTRNAIRRQWEVARGL